MPVTGSPPRLVMRCLTRPSYVMKSPSASSNTSSPSSTGGVPGQDEQRLLADVTTTSGGLEPPRKSPEHDLERPLERVAQEFELDIGLRQGETRSLIHAHDSRAGYAACEKLERRRPEGVGDIAERVQ